MSRRLPHGTGTRTDFVLKYNPKQVAFHHAHQSRVCPTCMQLVPARSDGTILCPKCERPSDRATRAYHRLSLFAGRRGGKTVNGAYAALQEMQVPGSNGIVAAPTLTKLFDLDSTFDTLVQRIPENWIKDWDPEYYNITLVNGARVGFRSCEDPQRLRGPGLHWLWLDEAREISEDAWDVVRPSLTEYKGVAIVTTSPNGFDWCYDRFWEMVYRKRYPGFWAVKWKTIENPIIDASEIAEARATMSPKMFAQEYEADFITFEGAIYDDFNDGHILFTDEQIRKFLPEWPKIDPSRQLLVGLDSGADHPFGGLVGVSTPRGILIVDEYLVRDMTLSVHKHNLLRLAGLRTDGAGDVRWAANKNERQLNLEFAQSPYAINLNPAENDVWAGIQRVQSWLYTKKLFFCHTVPVCIEQMRSYHMAQNVLKSGEKREKEKVFKKKDELPDCLRYMLMSWPELPKAFEEKPTERPIDDIPYESRKDVERLRAIHKQQQQDLDGLTPLDDGYPLGDFYA